MSDIDMPIEDELGDVGQLLRVAEELIAAIAPSRYVVGAIAPSRYVVGEGFDAASRAVLPPGSIIEVPRKQDVQQIAGNTERLVTRARLVCARVRSRLPEGGR